MTFKEWHKEYGEYSYIDPATVEAEKAWDYQQNKIDSILYEISTILSEEGYKSFLKDIETYHNIKQNPR